MMINIRYDKYSQSKMSFHCYDHIKMYISPVIIKTLLVSNYCHI